MNLVRNKIFLQGRQRGGAIWPGRRKSLFFLSFLVMAICFWPAQAKSEGSSGKGIGAEQAKVTFLQGKAEILPQGETSWKSLKAGSFLSREDEVRTGEKSRLEIQLADRSILRFEQKTTFKMKTVFVDVSANSREVKVEVPVGKTWANVRKVFGPKKTFEIASANAVAGVRDTIWRMSVNPDASTLIRVYAGTVEVYNPFVKPDYKPEEGGFRIPREVRGPQEIPRPYEEVSKEQWEEIVLTQMMQVTVPAVGRPEKPSAFKAEDDQKEEWVRWNQRRDKEIKP
ncbi:MAG: FecR domain-containing protein [Deltaproteobacteria bacterium]|nr:FecR domain-containing protein [Deltaproteobacteria bacterium]